MPTAYLKSLKTTRPPPPVTPKMLRDVDDSEVHQLATGLTTKYGAQASKIAVLAHLTRTLFSSVEFHHDTSLQPLLDLQRECLLAWLEKNKVPLTDVLAAAQGLKDAGVTLYWLSTLPN